MHSLFVYTAHDWSGTARAFVAAARGLARRGHTVTVVVPPDSTVEQVASQEAVVLGRAPLYEVVSLSLDGVWLAAARRLGAVARSRGAEVIFVHTDREHLVAAGAVRFGGAGCVVRRVPAGRTAALGGRGRVAVWLAPTAFMFASEPDLRATSLSGRAVAGVVAPVGVAPPEATGAPPGATTTSAAPTSSEPAGTDTGETIVCVHDASSRSRAATAIRTVAMLAPRHPNLQLVITGEGGYDDDLRMQASALNVLHRVTFLGERADELQVMRGAHLGWVVADADTAAYGILDLMALGIPVLGGEGTVAEHYVLSNITGVLMPPDDAHFTAACVAELLANAQYRTMMGHAARHRVAREFPEEHMIDGFERAAVAAMARRR